MKSCDEMVNSLLERRDKYNAEKKRKRTLTVKCMSCVCLVALLGVGIWRVSMLPPPSEFPPITSEESRNNDNSSIGDTEKSKPEEKQTSETPDESNGEEPSTGGEEPSVEPSEEPSTVEESSTSSEESSTVEEPSTGGEEPIEEPSTVEESSTGCEESSTGGEELSTGEETSGDEGPDDGDEEPDTWFVIGSGGSGGYDEPAPPWSLQIKIKKSKIKVGEDLPIMISGVNYDPHECEDVPEFPGKITVTRLLSDRSRITETVVEADNVYDLYEKTHSYVIPGETFTEKDAEDKEYGYTKAEGCVICRLDTFVPYPKDDPDKWHATGGSVVMYYRIVGDDVYLYGSEYDFANDIRIDITEISDNGPSGEPITDDETDTGEEAGGDEEPVESLIQYTIVSEPYAIIRLTEKTDDTEELYFRWVDSFRDCVKYKCETLFINKDSYFWEPAPYEDYYISGADEKKVFPDELWLSEECAESLAVGDIILVCMDKTFDVNGNIRYSPTHNDDGQPEYAVFIDDALYAADDWLETRSFYPIDWSNNWSNHGAEEHFPKYKLEKGTSLDDTIRYFEDILTSYEFLKNRK